MVFSELFSSCTAAAGCSALCWLGIRPLNSRRGLGKQLRHCNVALDKVFASGSFREVYLGRMEPDGQRVVVKRLKPAAKQVESKDIWLEDLSAVDTTHKMAIEWNELLISSKAYIEVLLPEVHYCPAVKPFLLKGEELLVEPYLEGKFTKWNNNNGWVRDPHSKADKILQAFSHWTYHASNGQFLVCDLQGVGCSGFYTLTDPVVLTQDMSMGVTDIGPKGMHAFFYTHTCNEFCSGDWLRIERPRRPSAMPGRRCLAKLVKCQWCA